MTRPSEPAGPAAVLLPGAGPAAGSDAGAAPAPNLRRVWVLAACCAVAFARSVDPKLWMMGLDIPPTAFGAGWAGYRVFSAVTVLLLLAGMLAGGLLGDVFGRRRVLVWGALVSAGAGVLTVFAPGVPWFVVTRSVDVAAGAVAFPLTLAVLRLTFSGRERPLALLVYTVATGGALLVALLALVLESLAGWRATLVLPVGAGLAGAFLAWRYVPESHARERVLRRAATASAWALALLPLTLGFLAARLTGTWTSPVSLTALALGAAGFVALALVWRGRVAAGVTERLPWRRRHLLTVMLLTGATLTFGLTGYALQLYGFFGVVQGYGPIVAGLALLPLLAAVLLSAPRVARLALRVDARRLIAGGLALMGVAAVLTALVRPGVPYWLLVPPLALFGLAFLAAQTAWTNAFMSALPDAVVGASAGILKATAATGAVVGGALLGTVLLNVGQADFARRLDALGLSPAQAAAAAAALDGVLLADAAIDRSVPPPPIVEAGLLAVYHEAYAVGVAAALLLAGSLCLVMAAVSWLTLEPRRPGQPPAGAGATDDAGSTLEAPI
jgi:MFS family permease